MIVRRAAVASTYMGRRCSSLSRIGTRPIEIDGARQTPSRLRKLRGKQPLEPLAGVLAGKCGIGHETQVLLLVDDEGGMVERDRTDADDKEAATSLAAAMHVMPPPEIAKRGRPLLKRFNQPDHVLVFGCLSEIPPETGQYLRSLVVPLDDPIRQAVVAEQHPQHVSFCRITPIEAEENLRSRVPADHVPAQVHDVSRTQLQIVDQTTNQRRQRAPSPPVDRWRPVVRQKKEMPPLRLVKLQHPRHIIEKGGRDVDVATLLQPRIPTEADARERCHFFSPQSRRPTPFARRKSDIERRETFAAPTQKVRQFRACTIKTAFQGVAHSNRITYSIVTGLYAAYLVVSTTGTAMSNNCIPATKASPSSSPSSSADIPNSSPLALAILLLGGFITVFDLFVVNVAIPSMQADLGADFAQIGFVIAGYELAFGVLLIAGGRLGDIHGRRKLFVLGMLGFAVTSFLCGVAPDATSLIFARFLQGATGAILFPQVYALLRVMYDEAGRRRAFGLLGMTLGLAAIAGQVLGGLIVQSDLFGLGWRIVFLINLPVGVAAAIFARTIPESTAPDVVGVDWPGVFLATIGLLLLLLPLLEGPNIGWPTWTWVSLFGSALFLAGFLAWERYTARRDGHPAVDLRLFANGGFSIGTIVVLLIYSTATSLFLCFALLLQSGLGLTPFEAGMLFAPASVGFVTASLLAPKLVARWGNAAIADGALIYAAGIAWLIATAPDLSSKEDALALIPALILFGFGQGLSMTPLLNLVIGFVEERHAGMAAGIISTMQQVGGAFGVSIVGIFFVSILSAHSGGGEPDISRYSAAFAGAMLYNLAAAVIAAVLIARIARKRATR